MDADLAYCLEMFIDDQIKLIDDNLDNVKEEEIRKHNEIQELKSSSMSSGKAKPLRGSHDEDEAIIQRFIQNLLDIDSANDTTDLQIHQEELRKELSIRIKECLDYTVRLRNLARPILASEAFVVRCKEVIKQLRDGQNSDDNYKNLCEVIDASEFRTVVENMQKWWRDLYGSCLNEIIQLNKRFNPGLTNNDIIMLPSQSSLITYARRIILTRNKESGVGLQKHDIVCEFVGQIQSVDDSNSQEISTDDLIFQLDNSELDILIDYAGNWLSKRDESRSQAKKDDYYDKIWQEEKAEFERQCIAHNAKKLALAALLRRLAIGSANDDRFDQKLQITLDEQKQTKGIPIITGDIREPNVEDLPISIHLKEAQINEWSTNSSQIQEEFSSSLCRALLIPDKSIHVTRVESGSVIIHAFITPPYGKNVIDSLNGAAPDSAARIQAVRQCCAAVKGKIESITLGDFGLSIDHKLMDATWNRRYVWSRLDTDKGEYWEKSINRGGRPYFCPSGWTRFGVKVAESDKEFDARWGDWYIAYHGTKDEYATNILISGLRVSNKGCFYEKGIPRVYVSPSIEYCAHPRYARPWTKKEMNGKTRWFQLVFQCRVNPKSIKKIAKETLIHPNHKNTVRIDPNFDNSELEWIITGEEGVYYIKKDIICYGLMMRVSDTDPKYLASSKWWQYAYS